MIFAGWREGGMIGGMIGWVEFGGREKEGEEEKVEKEKEEWEEE